MYIISLELKKDPVPAKPWDEGTLLDASREGPMCTQYNSILGEGFVHGQEDCLYLNIYTPRVIFLKMLKLNLKLY